MVSETQNPIDSIESFKSWHSHLLRQVPHFLDYTLRRLFIYSFWTQC